MPEMQPRRVKQEADAVRDAFAAAGNQTFNLGVPSQKEPAMPGLLPRDIPGFTGRELELARITRLAEGRSVAVAVVDGPAGVGKTALVVHVAHRLLSARAEDELLFPDGHLYADLRGCDTTGQLPAEPSEVLEVFLRRLGVGGAEIPQGAEERSGRLREMLASKRALLVLDNAASEAQVRPLLPGAGASLVLITSRPVLAGLEVDDRIDLGILPRHKATELLTWLAGEKRAAAEPEAVAGVVASCGGLPLALRIAGQLLAANISWSMDRLAEMLADERHRLDRLAAGDRQVRAAFEVSYRQLAGGDAQMFRLLGLYPGSHFDEDIAASLAELGDPKAAEPVLNRLAMAHLITEERAGRFRIHDLLRLFARQASEHYDDDADRVAAGERVAASFTNMAWYLDACLDPRQRPLAEDDATQAGEILPSQRNVLEQFAAEQVNLLAVIRFAADNGWHEIVWRLSEYMGGALTLLRHLDDLLTVREAALAAAKSANDTAAYGRALGNLGNVYAELRRFQEAIDCFEEAIECYNKALRINWDTKDRHGEGRTFNNLGICYLKLSQFDDALDCFEEDLAICRKLGDRSGEGLTLGNLGNIHYEMRRYGDATACYQQGQHKQAISYWQDAASSMSEAGAPETASRYERAASAELSRRRWWR